MSESWAFFATLTIAHLVTDCVCAFMLMRWHFGTSWAGIVGVVGVLLLWASTCQTLSELGR